MLIQVFWNKINGDVIVPTVVQTEAGYWLGIEPVECASWSDLRSVIVAVQHADARNGRIVPTPSRQNFPKPAVLPYSTVKSMNDFEKKYELASIFRSSEGAYSVERYKPSEDGSGGVIDPDASTTYPSGTSLDKIVEHLSTTIRLKTKA